MYEFLFKFSPTAFSNSKLVFANDLPLWLMFAVGVLFFSLLLFSLTYHRNILNTVQLFYIASLQFLMITIALIIVWRPALLTDRLVSGANTVAILLDTSSSMTLSDGQQSRMSIAQSLLTESSLANLRDSYTILPYGFTNNAVPIETLNNIPVPGNVTDIGQSLLQTLQLSSSASLGAIIILSDGADNNKSLSQQEISAITDFGVPIHTVGLGREFIPEDLELSQVIIPETALPGSTISAQINIRHDQGGNVRVKVYDGENFLTTKDVMLNPQQQTTTSFIDINTPDAGVLDLRFTVDPFNNETNLINNSRSHVVNVIKDKYKVLYIEGEPRWEYKFMQRALADDPSIQLSTLLRVTPNKFYRQGIDTPDQLADGFPLSQKELFDYDALLIGSVAVSEFSNEQQLLIHDFVSKRGGSLLMLAGLNGLGQGGWGESIVNTVLPATLSFDDGPFIREKAHVTLSDKGAQSTMLTFSSSPSENLALWTSLPEIADFQSIGSLRPAATTLLQADVNGQLQPLLVMQPYGLGKTHILATGGTWRWQMSLPLEDQRHERFWRQLMRSMVISPPRPFELSTSIDNDTVVVKAKIINFDTEDNTALSVSAVASSQNGDVISIELLPVNGQHGSYEASFNPSDNTLYDIEAISTRGDIAVDSTRTSTRINQNHEFYNTRQNRDLLENISSLTGGKYWTPEQWQDIPASISRSTAGISTQIILEFWHAPIFFFLLFGLKTIEWLLKRRWRTI